MNNSIITDKLSHRWGELLTDAFITIAQLEIKVSMHQSTIEGLLERIATLEDEAKRLRAVQPVTWDEDVKHIKAVRPITRDE